MKPHGLENMVTNVLVLSYFWVLFGNFGAMILCLIGGRRSWCRRLCGVALSATGLFLLLAGGLFAELYFETGLRQEAGGMAGIALFGCVPVVLELIGLLAISRWHIGALRPRRRVAMSQLND